MLMFYPAINLLEGRSMSKAVEDIKEKYAATMTLNYKVWPFASLINFMFMPI